LLFEDNMKIGKHPSQNRTIPKYWALIRRTRSNISKTARCLYCRWI